MPVKRGSRTVDLIVGGSERARQALIDALEEPDIPRGEAERIVDRVLARIWIKEGYVLTVKPVLGLSPPDHDGETDL